MYITNLLYINIIGNEDKLENKFNCYEEDKIHFQGN